MNRFFTNLQKQVRHTATKAFQFAERSRCRVCIVFVQVKDRGGVIFGGGQSPTGAHDPPRVEPRTEHVDKQVLVSVSPLLGCVQGPSAIQEARSDLVRLQRISPQHPAHNSKPADNEAIMHLFHRS